MKLAILFLFHENPKICANRLAILRKFNPDASIYGLYGGGKAGEEKHRAVMQGMLDDFYAFPDTWPAKWKWRNGDQIIAEWYRTRGKDLPWDTIIVIEWDMIVAGKIETVYSALKQGELLINGLRPVREIEHWWFHVSKRKPERRARYLAFLDHVRREHGYDGDPCCGFLFGTALPRKFLDRYSRVENPELGFLEYKIPIYAQIFGTPFCTAHPLRVWWDKPIFPWHPRRRWNPFPPRWMIPSAERALNAAKREIPLKEIRRQLRAPDGSRLFHPVFGIIPSADLQ